MTVESHTSDLLHEQKTYTPSAEFVANARVKDNSLYQKAGADYLKYWEDEAKELEWFEPWTDVLNWTPPHCEWFTNAKLNITHNCLDRHLEKNGNKTAIIWEGENYDARNITYQELYEETCQFANGLKSLGIAKGDRVAIYMPMVPEAVVAMLACARIGAIHSVVFGGFAPESIADRINDSSAKAIITADGGWRRGKVLPLKAEADKAIAMTETIEKVVVIKRIGEAAQCEMVDGRDYWYDELIADQPKTCAPEAMDAEDVLFTLYTSGTTGKPKGLVHTCGGYAVGTYTTTKYVFDIQEDDIYWCTADVGWITGHSYIVYGLLQNCATQVMYEGAPNFPNEERFWEMIQKHKVSIFYTAPTAIRAFIKWGEDLPDKYDLSSLRLLGTVGEPINPEAWHWYYDHIGGGKCPIVDTYWQTETGAIVLTGLPGVKEMKPGFAGAPMPGIEMTIIDDKGNPVEDNTTGLLAITKPWPSIARTIWGDDKRFVDTYFTRWNDPSIYFPGDGAQREEDGSIVVLGRVDDVLNVSGHRMGTMEVESALVDHHDVAESAVVGRSHEIKGQAIVCFVSLKAGVEATEELLVELRNHVGAKIGAIAKPDDIFFSHDLPKTRSGKIMRRLLRDIAEGRDLGDITTLADPTVVEKLRAQYVAKYGH